MKVVTRVIFMSTLMMGLAGVAYAQSANLRANGTNGLQAGGVNSAGAGLGTGLGTGLGAGAGGTSSMLGAGTMGGSQATGGTGGVGSGPVLNNMRANGTSLNMSPDPRAPNVTGKAFGQ